MRDRSTQVLSPDGKEPNLPGPNPSAQEGLVHHRDLFERLLPLPVVPSAAAEAPAGIPPRLTARENLPGQDVLTVVSGGPGPKADAAAQAEMPPEPFEESEAPPAAPWAGTPLAGILPFDLRALERGVDTFFMRLGQLQEDWRDPRSVVEVASLVAVMTAVGFEFARLRREARDQPGTEEAAEPDPAARFPGDDA